MERVVEGQQVGRQNRVLMYKEVEKNFLEILRVFQVFYMVQKEIYFWVYLDFFVFLGLIFFFMFKLG